MRGRPVPPVAPKVTMFMASSSVCAVCRWSMMCWRVSAHTAKLTRHLDQDWALVAAGELIPNSRERCSLTRAGDPGRGQQACLRGTGERVALEDHVEGEMQPHGLRDRLRPRQAVALSHG